VSGRLELLAPAKVNLLLEVLGPRPDGYHEIRTVLQTIDLGDRLVLEEAPTLELRCDLPELESQENLVVRAARALARAAGREPRVRIDLSKSVPPGSGLGGGSSDAAATLAGLCELWRVDPGSVDLPGIAASLGSDVPFFLWGGTALALGRGEIVFPLRDAPERRLLLARPARPLSTPEVYRAFDRRLTSGEEGSTISRFLRNLYSEEPASDFVLNDLEAAAAGILPEVRDLLDEIRGRGAETAALSGSGSAVFGIFADGGRAREAREALERHPATDRTWLCRTLGSAGFAAHRPWHPKGGGTRDGDH
jgi:4-diphosphocytidyl-2-C-methyl-D-erythritol kinase